MSAKRVVTSRRADEDIAAAVDHLIAEGAGDAALRLVDTLAQAKDRLADYPAIGSLRYAGATGIPELRGLVPRRFPYVLLYTDGDDTVIVHRVLHVVRDIPAALLGDDD